MAPLWRAGAGDGPPVTESRQELNNLPWPRLPGPAQAGEMFAKPTGTQSSLSSLIPAPGPLLLSGAALPAFLFPDTTNIFAQPREFCAKMTESSALLSAARGMPCSSVNSVTGN